MRISSPGLSLPTTPSASGEAAAGPQAAPAAPPALHSAALQPALAALRDLPEIDQAKVDALREALARGEVPLDTARLAGLIERYHGNRE